MKAWISDTLQKYMNKSLNDSTKFPVVIKTNCDVIRAKLNRWAILQLIESEDINEIEYYEYL
jgi:hypothetical protein